MVKLTDYAGTIEMELPIKVEFEDRVYWIKKSTKEGKGIFLNNQPPSTEVLVKENDSVNISIKIAD
jgi:hypothetical protein